MQPASSKESSKPRGGGFLLKLSVPASIFTPEELTEEHRFIRMAFLKRLTKFEPVNSIEARCRIARRLLDAERYVF